MNIKFKNYKRSESNKEYKKKKSLNNAKNKTFIYNNNQGYNMKFSGSPSKSKKNLDEMMEDYKRFLKKYFGNENPIYYISEERINEILEGKEKNNFEQNMLLQNQKNYLIYEKLAKNIIDSDFGNEEIEVQMPSANEIDYSKENRLGKHKNNGDDYNKRKIKFEKDNKILDENQNATNQEREEEEKKKKEEEELRRKKEEEELRRKKEEEELRRKKEEEEKDKEDIEDNGDKPEVEEKEIEEEDKANGNIAPAAKSPICDDYDTMQDKEIKAKKIQKIFREKRCGERLYLGMDKSHSNIIRIYVHEYDKNKKIKSIIIFVYLLLDGELLVLKKSIKELLKKDSISKNSLMKCMNEVIEKILARKEDTINLDLVSETAKSKGIISSSRKEEDIFVVKKKNVNKNKEDKKKDDKEKEDSLIGDADYNF